MTGIKNYRYPGTASFTNEQQQVFFGREEDIDKIITSIVVNKSTVIFGKSGTGKSSILYAGVQPKLEDIGKQENETSSGDYKIMTVRVHLSQENSEELTAKIKNSLQQLIGEVQPLEFTKKVKPALQTSLWFLFKKYQFQAVQQRSAPVIVLVFDQAEEIFTYPQKQLDDFITELEPICGAYIPKEVRTEISSNIKAFSEEELTILYQPLPIKFVFAIRSDKLHLITRLKKAIPGILQNGYELLPLTIQQAKDAIQKPLTTPGNFMSGEFNIEEAAVSTILESLSKQQKDSEYNYRDACIEPFSLQVVCQHIERILVPEDKDKIIRASELPEINIIIKQFYVNSLKELNLNDGENRAVRIFIEEKMLTGDGRRITMDGASIHPDINREILKSLVFCKLLKEDVQSEEKKLYEISHDCLVEAILMAKEERLGSRQTHTDELQEKITKLENELLYNIDTNISGRQTKAGEDGRSKQTSLETSKAALAGIELKNNYNKYKELGDLYKIKKNYDKTIENYTKAIEEAGKAGASTIEILEARADIYFTLKKYIESNTDYLEILKTNPSDAAILYYIGINYYRLFDDATAEKYFDSSANANQELAAETYNRVGNLYLDTKLYNDARKFYNKALEKNKEYYFAIYNIGLTYYHEKDFDTAIQFFQHALEINPQYTNAFMNIGNAYLSKQDLKNADIYFEKTIIIDAGAYDAIYNRGLVAYRMGDVQSAKTFFESSLEKNPDYALALQGLARIEKQLNNPEAAILHLQKCIQLNPNDANIYFDLGDIYLGRREYENAKEYFLKVTELENTAADGFYNVGLCYINLSDLEPAKNEIYLEMAKSYFTKALTLQNNYDLAMRGLARVNKKLKNYTEAERLLHTYIETFPGNAQGYLDLGDLYFEMQDYEKAKLFYMKDAELTATADSYLNLAKTEQKTGNYETELGYYEKAIIKDPQNAQVYQSAALCLTNLKRYEEAIDKYNTYLKLSPPDSNIYVEIGNLYYSLKEYDKAKEQYVLSINIQPNTSAYNNIGLCEEMQGNFETALTSYKEALRIDPVYTYSISGSAICLKMLGRYEEAIEYQQKNIEVNPELPDNYNDLGGIYFAMKDYEHAESCYRQAVKLSPDYYLGYYNLGWIKSEKNNFTEASEYYLQTIKLNPDYTDAYINVGLCFFHLKDYTQSEKYSLQAISIQPDNPNIDIAFNYLASAQLKLGKFNEALSNVMKSLQLNPKEADNYETLASIYKEMGEKDKAIENYKKALEINPNQEDAKDKLAELLAK